MKRMKIFAMTAALTVAMGTLTACGNADIDAMSDETVGYAEEVAMEDEDIKEDEVAIEDEAVAEDEADVEDEDIKEDKGIVNGEAVAEDEADVENEAVDEGTVSTNIEYTNTESINTEFTENASGGTASNDYESNGSQSSGSTEVAQPAPATPAPEPVHTHSWKEHYATTQVWVPNIVVVDDYAEQVTGKTDDVAICDCGYTTTNRDAIVDHIKSNILAGNDGHSGFSIQPGQSIVETVKVGSHEEDHGHYENSTYVDYYYCDCGATK